MSESNNRQRQVTRRRVGRIKKRKDTDFYKDTILISQRSQALSEGQQSLIMKKPNRC